MIMILQVLVRVYVYSFNVSLRLILDSVSIFDKIAREIVLWITFMVW